MKIDQEFLCYILLQNYTYSRYKSNLKKNFILVQVSELADKQMSPGLGISWRIVFAGSCTSCVYE